MGYVTRDFLATQFANFATRIALVFARKTELPTKVSDLTNDSGFVTAEEVNSLTAGAGVTTIVFDTKEALDAWLLVSANTASLKTGQNIYIKETDTPDYWWDGTQLQVLETEKVNLENYVDKDALETKLAGYVKTSDSETENLDFSAYFS